MSLMSKLFIYLLPFDSNSTKIIIHRLFEKICFKKDSYFNNFKSIIRVNSYKVKLIPISIRHILSCDVVIYECSSIIKLSSCFPISKTLLGNTVN